jgi:hypothetical protein
VSSTRTIDPDVARARARVAGLSSGPADPGLIQSAREELDRAKRVAAIRAAVRNAPPLDPAVRDSIVSALYAAGGAR